jgi:hypothetical protein
MVHDGRSMAELVEGFCGRCGKPAGTCDADCAGRHAFDPDRFCVVCGHRLDVQVFPDRVQAACKVCRVRLRRQENGRSVAN